MLSLCWRYFSLSYICFRCLLFVFFCQALEAEAGASSLPEGETSSERAVLNEIAVENGNGIENAMENGHENGKAIENGIENGIGSESVFVEQSVIEWGGVS